MNELTQIIIGLQIFVINGAQDVCAEHDEIFAGHGLNPSKLASPELVALQICGWVWNEEVDGWRRYV